MSRFEKSDWIRVTHAFPCGICDKPNWCTRGEKGWCCMRLESGQLMKNGGWFHPFGSEKPEPVSPASKNAVRPSVDCASMMKGWRNATTPQIMAEIAAALNVSDKSLRWLGVAWARERQAAAFPMYDEQSWSEDSPCGIRLRTMDGKKFAVTGSKSGIFFPFGAAAEIRCNRIFVCEGPTDTAACLDIGIFALGRASCRGGEEIVLSVLEQLSPLEVVVVSDNDGPGIEGADFLMSQITHRKVKITPPSKDMRQFVSEGGTAEILESMLKDLVRQ